MIISLYLDEQYGPALLSVFGGKITTYRVLAEEAVNKISLCLKDKGYKEIKLPWTEKEILPGGDIPKGNFDSYVKLQRPRYSFLPEKLIRRYARAYGTRMEWFLNRVHKVDDMGRHFGDNVYEAEILHLMKHEFALTTEDILWRRSKLGLHVDPNTAAAIEAALPSLYEQLDKLPEGQEAYENAASH